MYNVHAVEDNIVHGSSIRVKQSIVFSLLLCMYITHTFIGTKHLYQIHKHTCTYILEVSNRFMYVSTCFKVLKLH